jgi:hypothetical protein
MIVVGLLLYLLRVNPLLLCVLKTIGTFQSTLNLVRDGLDSVPMDF